MLLGKWPNIIYNIVILSVLSRPRIAAEIDVQSMVRMHNGVSMILRPNVRALHEIQWSSMLLSLTLLHLKVF